MADRSAPPSGGAAGELASPLPLAAVALLALNDHLLKPRFPGVVTGKLSDLAGCFVLPLFVAAVLAVLTRWSLRARLAAGAASTALLFAGMKLSPAVAALVSGLLAAAWRPLGVRSGVIVSDETDLVALPMIALAALHASSRRRRGAR